MRAVQRGRVVRIAAVGLGLAAIAVFATVPSAAANGQESAATSYSPTLTLQTVPQIKRYLRSLGVDPKGVVIQRGARNYAGPNCPGAAWNCTASTKVVQISTGATDGGGGGNDGGGGNNGGDENRFVCKRQGGGSGSSVTKNEAQPQSCFIVQTTSNSNSATCEIRTFGSNGEISQACFITQDGKKNTATAKLVAGLGSNGGVQHIIQRIEVKQTGGLTGNTLDASQTGLLGVAKNAGGAAVNTTQDFHQVICGNQIATGSGYNTATVKQQGAAAAAFSNAGDVTIDQNRGSVTSTCTEDPPGPPIGPGAGPFAPIPGGPVPPHDSSSCPVVSDSFGDPKVKANTCARIQQDAASGRNRITKQDQTNLLYASVNGAVDVDVEQGTLDGGIDSTQDQESTGMSSIVDVQDADQITSIRNATGSIDVSEIEDPRCCAGGHQLGNAGSTWKLTQDLSQRAYIDGALVDPELFADGVVTQIGADYGNCTSTGTCTVDQKVSNNVETKTNSCSGSHCDVFVECAAAGDPPSEAASLAVQQTSTCFATTDNPNCVITQDRSLSGETPTSITFDNQSGETVSIYWLDYEGDRVFYNTLPSDTSYEQSTWLTHPWVAIDSDSNCLGYTISDQPSKTYVIQPASGPS